MEIRVSRELPYIDPVDQIWLTLANRLDMKVTRSDSVFASWDGSGTLTISTPAGFDPDDCLAQMIFHEICHALVESPSGLERPDWGLENIDQRDLVREHACHRLQASLLAPHGLRTMLGPTTDHRPYYDALPVDPLAAGDDPAIPIAAEAHKRAVTGCWSDCIQEALRATAAIAVAVGPFAAGSLWSAAD